MVGLVVLVGWTSGAGGVGLGFGGWVLQAVVL